jgi:dihydrodipicolinate synthase/N-acetylneuraminate lyase
LLTVIPAHPLALTADRKLDERRQRALTRYYIASGVTGIAVGVHTTQFEIRDVGLFKPVLELARAEAARCPELKKIAGVCGPTAQAVREAQLARDLGYDAVLLSLAALPNATTRKLIEHSQAVADIIPVFGFYLQPAVGGRVLPYEFWRRFLEIANVIAIKIAPFNRYQTIDVVRALAESGRDDVTLLTGNDDSIIADLITPFEVGGKTVRFSGGLLGHWAVWTRRVVETTRQLLSMNPAEALALGTRITDANAVIFDAAHAFRGCIPVIHEILRRQGLLEGRWCLDPHEELSPGQVEEIDRIYAGYPELNDDAFIREHLDDWLR